VSDYYSGEPTGPYSSEPVDPYSSEPVDPYSSEPVGPYSSEPVGPSDPTRSYPVQPTRSYSDEPIGREPRRHRLRTTIIVVISVLAVLVAADFITKAIAEDVLASQIKSHGFPKKPNVTIQGFPFLTQVISRDIHTVDISANNVKTGPVTIKSVKAVLTGVHIDASFHGATVDRLTGSVFISFPEISNALTGSIGPLASALGGAGLTITAVGRHKIKASVNALVVSFSAVWRISEHGHDLRARLISDNGLPRSVLGDAKNVVVPLPALPLNLTIQRVSVTPDGIVGRLAGRNLTFNG
jgi:ABC-type thiamin/hydroxymethylpyrimidine transport system permease subunit